MRAKPASLALTMGEPGGIGPEIAAKAREALQKSETSFFVVGDAGALRRVRCAFERIDDPADAARVFKRALPLLDVGIDAPARAGFADPASAPAVIASVEKACALALDGSASAIVTCPIQKSSLISAGFPFPGHTEFLEHLAAGAHVAPGVRRRAVMMLAGPGLRTIPLTIHQPVRDAVNSITADLIIEKAIIVIEALTRDFGIEKPRIAVCGLNPHAGESGEIGHEERDIISPALERLRGKTNAAVNGPIAADSMFHAAARASYDAALCMLHDQALIPVKTLCFEEAVNITLGLPIVRTSPDHGTALDIAGKGVADARSLVAALHMAAAISGRRGRRG